MGNRSGRQRWGGPGLEAVSMGLDIYFQDDIRNALTALDQANRRALALAKIYGMDLEAARLCHTVYIGALSDVAASFGLRLGEPVETTLRIPAQRWAK